MLAVRAPAKTVTLAGATKLVEFEATVTTDPPVGAATGIVTVAVRGLPPTMLESAVTFSNGSNVTEA
jgi:hypothetical protein